jgi:hypothetical protein
VVQNEILEKKKMGFIDWTAKSFKEMNVCEKIGIITCEASSKYKSTTDLINEFKEEQQAYDNIERRKNLTDSDITKSALMLFSKIDPAELDEDALEDYMELLASLCVFVSLS